MRLLIIQKVLIDKTGSGALAVKRTCPSSSNGIRPCLRQHADSDHTSAEATSHNEQELADAAVYSMVRAEEFPETGGVCGELLIFGTNQQFATHR